MNLEIYQLLIPAICTGVLLIGCLLFIFIYIRYSIKLYLSMLLICSVSFIFALSEMIIIISSYYKNLFIGMQFHRIEHLAAAFFLFTLPYLIYTLLKLNPTWQKINKIISIIGLILSFIFLIAAFIFPDTYISQTIHRETWLNNTWDYTRGQEGFLITIRDIILFITTIYCIICLLTELILYRGYYVILITLIGVLIAIYCATDDIIYIHKGYHIPLFPKIHFSRFTLGITILIVLLICNIIKQFIDQAKEVEKAYLNIDSAYRVLHNSEQRFIQLTENMDEIFMLYDYKNNVILYVSPAYETIWGQSCGSLQESFSSFFDPIHQEDKEAVENAFNLKNKKENIELTFRIISSDTIRWIRCRIFSIRDKNNNVYRLATILEDITERKHSEDKLMYIAYHDILTGLPNRRSFFERFTDLIIQARRQDHEKNQILLFIDLDKLKNINDTLGHDYGDKLIKEVSNRLQNCVRESDYVYRLGGDEFTIILTNIAENIDAAIVSKKILESLSNPYNIDGREVFIGLSIGISIYPKDGEDVYALIKNADIALQDAKKDGNTYRFFSTEMNSKAQERLAIENSLRYAIDKNQFSLYYQPVVNSNSEIISMEALIRWKHPEFGFIPPDKFIPIAESTGLIIDIGDWTIRTACTQIKKWQDAGFNNLKVAVNLSALQFMDEKLIEKIDKILYEINLDSKCLELEITESYVMKNPEIAVNKINELYSKGISFSIDDFGTGYSSLSYLKRFKIDNLKVDRSFIKDVIIDQNNTEITRAIIAMAHNLRLKVIAEGVETIEQMEFLKSLNCDLMQGYLFSKPIPADDFTKLLYNGITIDYIKS